MSSSIGMIILNIWKNLYQSCSSHHQPVHDFWLVDVLSTTVGLHGHGLETGWEPCDDPMGLSETSRAEATDPG